MDGASEKVLQNWKEFDKSNQVPKKDIKYFHEFQTYVGDEAARKPSALLLTTRDDCYAIGYNNEDNLLALGGQDFANATDVPIPRRVDELSGRDVKKLSISERFGAALTSRGKLLYWGMEMRSLQFEERRKSYVKLPYEPKPNLNVVDMACGAHSITLLSDQGEIIIWGCVNLYYSEFYDFKVLKLRPSVKVKSLSSGWYHVALLSEAGEVWTFGYGSVGQLGYAWSATEMGYVKPRKVPLPSQCTKVECGTYSTLFLLKTGELFACGSNTPADYLCVGKTGSITVPTKVVLNQSVSDIAATYAWSARQWQSRFTAVSGDAYFQWGDDPKAERPPEVESATSLDELFVGFKTPQSLGKLKATDESSLDDKIGVGIVPTRNNLSKIDIKKWAIFSQVDQDLLEKAQSFAVFGAYDGDDSMKNPIGKTYSGFIVTIDGEVWAVGYNGPNELLGVPLKRKNQLVETAPVLVNRLVGESWRKIIVNQRGGVALTQDGKVYDWTETLPESAVELFGQFVVDVSCGARFVLYSTSNTSEVIFNGRMSEEYDEELYRKIAIPDGEQVAGIASGEWHCAVLTAEFSVFTFGHGNYNQLGYSWKKTDSPYEPKAVKLPGRCTLVVCGVSSTFFLLESGELYACGINTYADVLGVGHGRKVTTPEKVKIDEPLADMTAAIKVLRSGGRVSSFAAQSVSGKIYKWGEGVDHPTVVENVSTLIKAFEGEEIPQDLSLIPLTVDHGQPTSSNVPTPVEQHSLFDDPLYSDVTIKLADGTISAHKAVLYGKSPFFQKALREAVNQNELDMTAYNPRAMRAILKYFYGLPVGQWSASLKDVADFEELAEKNGDAELMTLANRLLAENTLLNMLQWYSEQGEQGSDFGKAVDTLRSSSKFS